MLFGILAARDATLLQAGTYAAIYGIAAIGLSVLLGNVAQISIGQAGFFGIGAYALGFLTASVSWPSALPAWLQYVLGTVAAVALATALGLVLGFIALRFRGHYLAMATLAFGLICVGVFRESKFLGGASGIDRHSVYSVRPLTIAGARAYWFAWLRRRRDRLLTLNLLRGRAGRAFEAIRNDELAAEMIGVPTRRYKIFAFAYAGALAGSGGLALRCIPRARRPERRRRFAFDRLAADGRARRRGGVSGRADRRQRSSDSSNIYGHDLENCATGRFTAFWSSWS